MRPGDIRVKVDGLWLESLAHVGQVVFSSRWGEGPCGPDAATVTVDLPLSIDTNLVRLGRTVEIYDRGVLVFGGKIAGFNREFPRTITVKSWARRAWDSERTHLPAERVGYYANGEEFTPTDPTTHRWLLDASEIEVGVADDRLYTQVEVTYATAIVDGQVTSTATVTRSDPQALEYYGLLIYELDVTDLGLIGAPAAEGFADDLLRQFAVPEWTSRVSVPASRLLTRTGLPAHLPDVAAGQMVRLFRLPRLFGGTGKSATTDVILGEVSYDSNDPDVVTIAPQRVAVRSLADLAREVRKQQQAAA